MSGLEKGKDGLGMGIKIIFGIIVLAMAVLCAAWLTLNMTVTNVTPGNTLPFTTSYGVSFPEGSCWKMELKKQ